MSNDQQSSRRKRKFSIDPVRVTDQDQASVKRVLGRLTGRVPFPEEEDAAVPRGSTHPVGNTHSEGNTHEIGTTSLAGITYAPNNTQQTDDNIEISTARETGHTSPTGTTYSTGITSKTGTTKRAASARQTHALNRQNRAATPAAVSPERDFQKVPNSVTREMAARLFRGKSKQLYDYLWSQSRGAITPARTVRRSRPQLMRGAGFGSMGTVERCVDFLTEVGLIKVRTIVGESEGNEYEIFTPEEVAPALLGLPFPIGSTHETGNTGSTPKQVVPVLPETGNTGYTSTSSMSVDSGGPKTSFKTENEKPDDEALAGLVSLLKQAAEEVTGKGTTPAERDRWSEVAELLVTELKIAAARTTVSSAPAFLAEHLRRRLRKSDTRQIEREVEEAASSAKLQAPQRPELTHEQVQEQANLISLLLRDGAAIEELEEQLAPNYRPSQWHMIRSIALAQAKVLGAPAKPDETEK